MKVIAVDNSIILTTPTFIDSEQYDFQFTNSATPANVS